MADGTVVVITARHFERHEVINGAGEEVHREYHLGGCLGGAVTAAHILVLEDGGSTVIDREMSEGIQGRLIVHTLRSRSHGNVLVDGQLGGRGAERVPPLEGRVTGPGWRCR